MKKLVLGFLGFMILLSFSVMIANNLIADGVRRQLISAPLPEDTVIADAASRCGKLYGCGNGMQYTGAILLKTGKSRQELEQYYQSRVSAYCKIITPDQCPECIRSAFQSFPESGNDPEHMIVSLTLDRETGNLPETWAQSLLDLDLRGH